MELMRNQLFMRGWKPTLKSFSMRLKINRKMAFILFFHEVINKLCITQNASDKHFDKIHEVIEKYLKTESYMECLEKNIVLSKPNHHDISNISPIWICWWQGENAMPEIVKVCYQRILKFAGNHPVLLVTLDNYKEYVNFNPKVISKFENKELLPAHLADLLRLKLLDSYGGLWLDATIFLSRPLDENVFEYDFYSLSNDCKNHISVSNFRWCSFVLGCKKGNPLMHSLAVAFEKYIAQESCFIHYLVIDYFIDMLYKHNDYVRNLIDGLPSGGRFLHTLRELYSHSFDRVLFDNMLADTKYFKLTYKENLIEKTQRGEETFYSHLKNLK